MLSADYYLPSFGGTGGCGSGVTPAGGDAHARRLSLEAEIQSLRSRMEQLFVQEKSFTSDKVIAVSSLLDLKINEYMRGRHRKGE